MKKIWELFLLLLMGLSIFSGIICIEMAVASFMALWYGIKLGMIIALGFAGLNLIGLGYIGLELYLPKKSKNTD